MVASNATMILPNPHTPMAFLPPLLAIKITNLTYGAVGSLAVLLWDIILHIPQDYKLATQFRINHSFITYCIARLATLAYIFGVVILTTTPVGHCDLLRQISILSPFTVPLSVLPFVMRVSALYSHNKFVIVFFSTTWLFVLASYIVAPIDTVGQNIHYSAYCLNTRTKLANGLTSSSVFLHDFLIFLATSWAFMRNSYSDVNMKNGIRVMVFGKYLPAFSRSILRDGQAYFLATLILNLLFVILCYIPKAPIAPCAIGFPFFVMLNNMSSHVYRNLRFGIYTSDSMITTAMIENVLREHGQPHHHEVVFKSAVSASDSEEKLERDLEAGDIKSNESLAQGTEGEKVQVEV